LEQAKDFLSAIEVTSVDKNEIIGKRSWPSGLLSLNFCHVNTNVGCARPGYQK